LIPFNKAKIMHRFFVFICLLIANQSFAQQKADLVTFRQLQEIINAKSEKTYIINFWATWCRPCIAELPSLQKYFDENTDKNVELILVSFDFPNQIKQVNKFIEKKKLKPKVYLINEQDQNAFIDKVSEKWNGTIPATWFVNNTNKKQIFVEKPINEVEIYKYLKEIL
jgi:thiol-disulfide isomerase/thioredoxin